MDVRRFGENEKVFFLTAVTYQRKAIFNCPRYARLLEAMLFYYQRLLLFELLGYVIMPDHLHLIVRPRPANNCSVVMNYVKGDFARQYNLQKSQHGKIWRPRFQKSIIHDENVLTNFIEYVHDNPKRNGLAGFAGEWPYSSWKFYNGGNEKIMQFIDKV